MSERYCLSRHRANCDQQRIEIQRLLTGEIMGSPDFETEPQSITAVTPRKIRQGQRGALIGVVDRDTNPVATGSRCTWTTGRKQVQFLPNQFCFSPSEPASIRLESDDWPPQLKNGGAGSDFYSL